MSCDYKRIKTVKLCRADLKHLVELQQRVLDTSDLDSSNPVEVFTKLRDQWVAIETVSPGAARFGKINVDDNATHIFWMLWDVDIPEPNFILNDGKRYKVLKIENINELNTTIAIQVTERGDETLGASEA